MDPKIRVQVGARVGLRIKVRVGTRPTNRSDSFLASMSASPNPMLLSTLP